MTKARTAKVLALAAANIAAVGIAASPANASAQLAAGPARDKPAHARRSHPRKIVIKLDGRRARKLSLEQVPPAVRAAHASAKKTAGFVPKASKKGVRPDTETGCSGSVCLGVYGAANYVSYVNTSWFAGSGCQIGHIQVWVPDPNGSFSSYPSSQYGGQNICQNQEYQIDFEQSYPTGTSFCGYFNNISGEKCMEVGG